MRPTTRLTVLLALVAAAACGDPRGARAQAARDASAAASDTLKFPVPDRPVSRIVAPRWIGEDIRDRFGEAARVITLSGVRDGMTVADIGAGDGYYVVRLAPKVGARGKVLGEDIMPDYVALLEKRIASEKLTNVEAVLGTPDDPRLPPASVDVAFMIHMYHEITQPYALLWNLSRALKPSGTLTIVDQDGPTDQHGTPPALLRCELGVIGYEQLRKTTLDDGAYAIVFRAPKATMAPAAVRERLAKAKCTQ